MRELSPLFGTDTLELGTHYHYTRTSHTRDTVRRVDHFITISPSRTHVLPDRAAILDFAKGAFFEANGVSQSKKGLKKERRPIANRQLLYQLSLLPHFFASWCYRYSETLAVFANSSRYTCETNLKNSQVWI